MVEPPYDYLEGDCHGVCDCEKIGDSMVLELSPELELELDLKDGARVEVQKTAYGFRIKRSGYSLAELLAQCDYSLPMDEEEREWIDAPRVGRELI